MTRKNLSIALFALIVIGICAQESFAQASGVKPELIMYRHNSSGGGNSPTSIVTGDILGTLKWNGLTAISAIRTGASIKSVTRATTPGSLTANMIFSTNDGSSLNDNMILTETGLVGIGILAPAFNLDVVGNTHTSGRFHGRIHFDQLSALNDPPSSYTDEAYFERKFRSILGVPPIPMVNNFGGVLSLAPGGGAYDHQLFFGQDGIWTRRDPENNLAWAGAWYKLLTSEDINGNVGRLPRFKGATPGDPSSTLENSQVFDNGTNVSIGGNHPPTPPAAVDAAYMLTVNNLPGGSAAIIRGDTRITGNATISTSLPGNGNLSVEGASRLVGKVAIGPGTVSTTGLPDHSLYVGGSILTEEVVVKLKINWPDYVFAPGRQLQPLSVVEGFVQKNGHLPGVPSQAEVAEKGLGLGSMQTVQMEKIEELYLHLIALEKRLNALEAENTALKHALGQKK